MSYGGMCLRKKIELGRGPDVWEESTVFDKMFIERNPDWKDIIWVIWVNPTEVKLGAL